MRKLKRHGPGSNSQTCGKSCRKACCEEAPPATLRALLGTEGCNCTTGNLEYTTADNPDGHAGMWVAEEIQLLCNGDGCTQHFIKIEVWCNHTCGACDCTCYDWSMRLNEGTIYRISEDNFAPVPVCCCGGTGGRNWAFWDGYFIEEGECAGDAIWLLLAWDSENICLDAIQTGCCVASISRHLNLYLNGPCGLEGPFDLVNSAEEPGCNSECGQLWEAEGIIHCRNLANECFEMDFTFQMCCNGIKPVHSGDPGRWYAKLTTDCTAIGSWNAMSWADCPDCNGTPFFAANQFGFSFCNEQCDASDNEYGVWIDDKCNQTGNCPGMPGNFAVLRVVLYSPDTDCPCGQGQIVYESVSNACGCVGQWRGAVTVWRKVGDVCVAESVEVKLCTTCTECVQIHCECETWLVTIDGAAAATEDCCCGNGSQRYRSWVDFTGEFNGRIYWGMPDAQPLPREACIYPLPAALYFDFTDLCGNTATIQIGGGTTCDDPDYFASWSAAFVTPCHDGSECTTPQTFHVVFGLKRDYTWQAVLTGCFEESPKTVTAVATCGVCNTSKFSAEGVFPGSFTGCDGECNTSNPIPFAITEV